MLLQIDSKQEVKWATVLFPPDIDDIIYCSVMKRFLNFLPVPFNVWVSQDQNDLSSGFFQESVVMDRTRSSHTILTIGS